MFTKRTLSILLLFVMLFTPLKNAFAFTIIEAWGEVILSGPYYDSTKDMYYIDLKDGVTDWAHYKYWSDEAGTKLVVETDIYAEDQGRVYFEDWLSSCNGMTEVTWYDYAKQEVGYTKYVTTEIKNPPANCDGGDNGDDGGTEEPPPSEGNDCIGCDLFNCPGWETYMGKLNEIKNAIPPAPNWQSVANTFRDTIAPRIKEDMRDLLGSAPNPSMPDIPGMPSMPSVNIDTPDKPTGNEAPGLGDSSFDENDVKNAAPKIPERDDPTGGFEINNPIDTLPSQDEFTKNVPDEGTAAIPAAPNEPENQAPEPEEPENVAPTPEEPENEAPTPVEPENQAPTPTEPENVAPTPEEPENVAPTPTEPEEPEPIPMPTPSEPGNEAPIPNENWEAPIPNESWGGFPMPTQ